MYRKELNATINETLDGISALSPDDGTIPHPDTIHSYVASQIDKLEEKYCYYTLHDLRSSESIAGPRVSVKSFRVLNPRQSRHSGNLASTGSVKKLKKIGSNSSRRDNEVFVVSTGEVEDDPETLMHLLNTPKKLRTHAQNKRESIEKLQSIKIPVNQTSSKINVNFKNLSKYKPKKHKISIIPAQKRTQLIKWTPNKDILSEIGGEYSPELNMTADKVASVVYERLSPKNHIIKLKKPKHECLNLFPITCNTKNKKIRVCPTHIHTSQLHDLSKMQLEFLNMRLSLSDRTVQENAFKDYHEIFDLSKNLSPLNTDTLNKSITNEDEIDTVDYELSLVEPEIHDLYQLRGRTLPTWCPGLFISVPHQTFPFEVAQLDQMLEKIWKEMCPFS